MPFESVDALQETLTDHVFHYAADPKKAAGRALGTLVEIVTYYTISGWHLRDHIVIERSVPEFANPPITHNVEFSLHPIMASHLVSVVPVSLPLTAAKIQRHMPYLSDKSVKRSLQVISSKKVKRNAAVLVEDTQGPIVAHVDYFDGRRCELTVCQLLTDPFAIFECKRVGVEKGLRKGPQTIEKAKQGAYVSRSVSALQKLRLRNGRFHGIIERSDGSFLRGPYEDILQDLINSASAEELEGLIMTVGVVSNHGNWFTADNYNKELRVLAQSYDWLLFLTDAGLSQFIRDVLLQPTPELQPARDAFLASYSGKKGGNVFTKVRMACEADLALQDYFAVNAAGIETWFNVIAPATQTLSNLRRDLRTLADKDWKVA